MTNFLENEISISYQRDDFTSYMIIKVEDEDIIINYQTEMITNNKIPKLLQVDIRRKNNEAYFYYDITSKITLSQFLNRKKVTKEELVTMLVQITETMLACTNFLLNNKCFILQEKCIYINPATNEIYLLYLPLSCDANATMSFRNFVINLIIYSADIDYENTSDNYIQKILNYVKCETFNIADFNKLLMGMCNEDIEDVRQEDELPDENMKVITCSEHSFKKNSDKQEAAKDKMIGSFVIAGISQLIIFVLLLLSKDFIKSLSGNIKTTYFAIGLIIVAVEIVIFKNLFERRKRGNIEFRDEQEYGYEHEYRRDYEYEDKYEDSSIEECCGKTVSYLDTINDIDDYDTSIVDNIPIVDNKDSLNYEDKLVSNHQYNTVLLAIPKEEKPFLRCMKDGVIEEVLINNSDFIIGRLEGYVDYIIKNNAVGKVHAQITTRDGKYYLKDLNSRNGTFLNDIQIESNTEHEIKNGDRIAFANSDYEFKVY